MVNSDTMYLEFRL